MCDCDCGPVWFPLWCSQGGGHASTAVPHLSVMLLSHAQLVVVVAGIDAEGRSTAGCCAVRIWEPCMVGRSSVDCCTAGRQTGGLSCPVCTQHSSHPSRRHACWTILAAVCTVVVVVRKCPFGHPEDHCVHVWSKHQWDLDIDCCMRSAWIYLLRLSGGYRPLTCMYVGVCVSGDCISVSQA